MAFLILVFRAALFLVVLPLLAYGIADIFLPRRGFLIPMAGSFDLSALVAAIVFIVGFLTWAQRPLGERNPIDDSPDTGSDFDPEN